MRIHLPLLAVMLSTAACVGVDGFASKRSDGTSSSPEANGAFQVDQGQVQNDDGTHPVVVDAGDILTGHTLDGTNGDGGSAHSASSDAGAVSDGQAATQGSSDAGVDAASTIAASCAGLPREDEPNNDVGDEDFIARLGICGALSTGNDVDRFEFSAPAAVINFVAADDATITVRAQGQSVTLPSPAVITGAFAAVTDFMIEVRSPKHVTQAYLINR